MDVTDSPRIEELRLRLQKDPSSIAFAQLAEECRRAGDYEEAVSVCRAGLARHPAYLSARVTLGRALMELDRYDEARTELEAVLNLAPDNLAAIRVLAEIHQRRGELGETLKQYAAARDVASGEPMREPAPIDSTAADAVEADLPIAVEADTEVGPAQPLEALDALDALTLDLPPTPPAVSWSFDLPPFDLAADVNLDLPGGDPSPDLPRGNPSPDLPPLDEWTPVVQEPEERGPAREPEPAPYPALQELEQWLAAIVDDRSNQR